jgi:hypothetical protein
MKQHSSENREIREESDKIILADLDKIASFIGVKTIDEICFVGNFKIVFVFHCNLSGLLSIWSCHDLDGLTLNCFLLQNLQSSFG